MIYVLFFLLGFLLGLFTLAILIEIRKANYKHNIKLRRKAFKERMDYLTK